MTQNTSSAVMSQRIEPSGSLDDFPTPPWAGRALLEHVISPARKAVSAAPLFAHQEVLEPAVNRGFLAAGLADYFKTVEGCDIQHYPLNERCPRWTEALADGRGVQRDEEEDFLQGGLFGLNPLSFSPHWIITNPPFNRAEEFAFRCAELEPSDGFAFLLRTSFLEGQGRFADLFSIMRPSMIGQFSERVIMAKGRMLDPARKYADPQTGKLKRPSTATAYAWIVWERRRGFEGVASYNARSTRFEWIPPCRVALERPGAYPEVAA